MINRRKFLSGLGTAPVVVGFNPLSRPRFCRSPIGSVVFDQFDWIAQYGTLWPEFAALKQRFDPNNILKPGPAIST